MKHNEWEKKLKSSRIECKQKHSRHHWISEWPRFNTSWSTTRILWCCPQFHPIIFGRYPRKPRKPIKGKPIKFSEGKPEKALFRKCSSKFPIVPSSLSNPHLGQLHKFIARNSNEKWSSSGVTSIYDSRNGISVPCLRHQKRKPRKRLPSHFHVTSGRPE